MVRVNGQPARPTGAGTPVVSHTKVQKRSTSPGGDGLRCIRLGELLTVEGAQEDEQIVETLTAQGCMELT
ncbi:MAG TPA: hypothetical protein VFN43_00275 [Humibacillus sp.]|nr:hypothetical protein [Humibacillus sp.]